MQIAESVLPQQKAATSLRFVALDVGYHPDSSISEITERTGLPQSLVSMSVAKLRDLGVVQTEPDPADRRRTLVHPTAVMEEGHNEPAARRSRPHSPRHSLSTITRTSLTRSPRSTCSLDYSCPRYSRATQSPLRRLVPHWHARPRSRCHRVSNFSALTYSPSCLTSFAARRATPSPPAGANADASRQRDRPGPQADRGYTLPSKHQRPELSTALSKSVSAS